ncbi:MAG TPA: FxLYD domain-containing protein, partial [Nitrososphaeraceae archaeon]|nr:FxLYD domain-containing protein [Nitrososphaeraceae archaeon]
MQTNTTFDQSGLMHLFGEISNISDRPQQDIAIFANFYDRSGKNIGNGSGIVPVRSLNMGDISPFEIILLDSEQS